MIPGELLDHVIIHQERAANHSHYEVGDSQVGDQQIGEVPEFLVSGQSGYEEEVTEAAHQHDADKHGSDDDGGHKVGQTLCGVWHLLCGNAIVHVIEVCVSVMNVQNGHLTMRFHEHGRQVSDVCVLHGRGSRGAGELLWVSDGILLS